MSATGGDELISLNFKENLNSSCFAKTGFIQWINNSEFLLIFDSFCFIYRLKPFQVAASLTDKFPVSITRIEIENRLTPMILNYCLNLLKHPDVDANFARASADASLWSQVNDTVADPVFLQPALGSGVSLTAATELDATVAISHVLVEEEHNGTDLQAPTGSMIIMLSTDGRADAALKIGQEKYDVVSLTSVLYDYVSDNAEIIRMILPELVVFPPTTEEPTTLPSLKNIRQLGHFLSTSYWFPTKLRFPDNPKEACAISLQRSGHFVRWRYTVEPGWRSFRVVGVSTCAFSGTATAAITLHNSTDCALLLGTSNGDILYFPVGLPSENDCLRVLSKNDSDGIRVSMMRLFSLDDDRHLLMVSRHIFLTAFVLTSSITGVDVAASATVRTAARFAVTDIIQCGPHFYAISTDQVTKYDIRIGPGVELRILEKSILTLDNEKVVGFTFSANGVMRFEAIMKRFFDRYFVEKPLSLRVRTLVGAEELWSMLMARGDLKNATDCLMLLRSFILHPEDTKLIAQLLIRGLDSLDSDTTVDIQKLKVFRLATTIFSGKRLKAADIEMWNRAREKIDRLLLINAAQSIAQRASALDRLRRSNEVVRQVLSSAVSILTKEGIHVDNDFGELCAPRCPVCAAESFQSPSISEHVCANNHRIHLVPLVQDIDCCHFCDGDIVAP